MNGWKEDFELIAKQYGIDASYPEWVLFFLALAGILVVLIDPFGIFW